MYVFICTLNTIFLTHFLNFGCLHLVTVYTVPGLLSQCKKKSLFTRKFVLRNSTCRYFCVCVSCSKATALPYIWTTICWTKLKRLPNTSTMASEAHSSSGISIILNTMLYDTADTQNILPGHPMQHGSPTFEPVMSRHENLSLSRYSPKIRCVFFCTTFPIDFGTT